jgi:RecA/RadA recombinase
MAIFLCAALLRGISLGKFDISKVVSDVQKLYKEKGAQVNLGSKLRDNTEDDCISMPEWFQKGTNTKGLYFGKIVQIAGDSDSGKTSAAIAAMKAAQAQGCAVLYVETEDKTTAKDLKDWGVDPDQIMLAKSAIAEEAYTAMFQLYDGFFAAYPKGELLLVIDSVGNVVSKHDENLDMSEGSSKPGGKGKTNRVMLNKLVARGIKYRCAVLLCNYTYANIGSPGNTNAGGKALNFFSALTYQTSRKGWIEKTVKGEKVRIGAKVQWKLFKNHISRTNPGPKVIELDITAEGIKLVGVSNE